MSYIQLYTPACEEFVMIVLRVCCTLMLHVHGAMKTFTFPVESVNKHYIALDYSTGKIVYTFTSAII